MPALLRLAPLRLDLILAALASTMLASAAFAAAPISRADATELKRDAAGHYRLENGREVRLTLVDDRLYLDLNRWYRREVQPVADRVLASRDGRLTVQYMAEGPMEQILIQHPDGSASTRLGERSWRGR